MKEIIIDEEFKGLLPALDAETYRLLEENIMEHGCRDALVLWNGILVDGYNRYAICSMHNIPFKTVDKEFDSREEALIWIISNQVSRRNLTPLQLSHYRGLHYKADRKIQGSRNQFAQKSEKCKIYTFQSGSTAGRLADQYRVSPKTIHNDVKIAEALNIIGEISPEAKKRILSGEVAVNKSRLQALPTAPKEEAASIVAEIDGGTYKRRAERPAGQTGAGHVSEDVLPKIKELNQIISNFAKNFDSMFREFTDGGPLELKAVLRSYINRLEDLYNRI